MTTEKRKRKRVSFIIQTEFIPDSGERIYPLIQDLSMNGLFLQTEGRPGLGTKGKIEILLQCGNEEKKLSAQCRVIRHVAPSPQNPIGGVGLEIYEIDPDSSILLFNIIKYQTEA